MWIYTAVLLSFLLFTTIFFCIQHPDSARFLSSKSADAQQRFGSYLMYDFCSCFKRGYTVNPTHYINVKTDTVQLVWASLWERFILSEYVALFFPFFCQNKDYYPLTWVSLCVWMRTGLICGLSCCSVNRLLSYLTKFTLHSLETFFCIHGRLQYTHNWSMGMDLEKSQRNFHVSILHRVLHVYAGMEKSRFMCCGTTLQWSPANPLRYQCFIGFQND